MERIGKNNETRPFEEPPFACWGQVEFCVRSFDDHILRALETAGCVELTAQPIQDVLWEDPSFLQWLVRGMLKSMDPITSVPGIMQENLKTRLMNRLRSVPYRSIICTEHTAKCLRGSRRQLYRVVDHLLDCGALHGTGQGNSSWRHHSRTLFFPKTPQQPRRQKLPSRVCHGHFRVSVLRSFEPFAAFALGGLHAFTGLSSAIGSPLQVI